MWITYYVGDFNSSVDCPNVELHQYSLGVLAMDSTFITTSRNTNVSTLRQHPSYYYFYDLVVLQRVDCLPGNSYMDWKLAPHTRLAYDAVWMLALALNRSLSASGNADCGDTRMMNEQHSCFNASSVPFRGLSVSQ